MKHKKILKSGKLSFTIIFSNMVLLWTSWFMLCGLGISDIYLPQILHYFGIVLVITGIIVFLTALFTIRTLENYEGGLITHGIYSRIRHPMYLGFLLWLIGAPLIYGGMYSFILLVPFGINVLFWRYLEEIELEKRFPSYKFYKRRTFF
jgi:protein-S-isoprenylcysteine O-methyltransferase Ste14